MAFRDDALGMFWTNLGREKATKVDVPRVLPPTPDTGWRPPDSFPNLSVAKRIAVDLETKDLELREKGPGVRRGAHIIGIAVGTDDGGRWYFPMRHEVGSEHNLDPDSVIAWARDNLSGPCDKVGANLLYEADFLQEAGVILGGRWLDVQVAEPLLNENRFSYALDALGMDHLGEGKVHKELSQWVHKAYRNKNYREELWRTSPVLVGPYAEGDVDLPLRILDKQLPKIAEQGLDDLWQIETELLPMLLAMRRFGVRINMAQRDLLDVRMTEALKVAQQTLDSAAGRRVNVNAGKDLALVFDKAGVAYPRTKGGAPSFAKTWMAHSTEPLCQAVTEIRRLAKLRDTFVRSYTNLAVNGRIHCQFHSLKGDEHGAVSGRFASSDPNLQNIPIRDPIWGPLIRALFLPEDDCDWYRHDWSQIEYRFLVHFGVGESARQAQHAYRADPTTDFHKFVMGLTALGRKEAKNANFLLVYGGGAALLANMLGISKEEAQRTVFDVYHDRLPFVRDTYDRAQQRANMRGYVLTILKRRARFPMWEPTKWGERDQEGPLALPEPAARARWGSNIRRAWTHTALNRVLQGSAADLMKKAMRDCWKSGVYNVLPVPHLTVHDELGHSVQRTKEAHEAIAHVKYIMENCMQLRVPIITEVERGPSWGEVTDGSIGLP